MKEGEKTYLIRRSGCSKEETIGEVRSFNVFSCHFFVEALDDERRNRRKDNEKKTEMGMHSVEFHFGFQSFLFLDRLKDLARQLIRSAMDDAPVMFNKPPKCNTFIDITGKIFTIPPQTLILMSNRHPNFVKTSITRLNYAVIVQLTALSIGANSLSSLSLSPCHHTQESRVIVFLFLLFKQQQFV